LIDTDDTHPRNPISPRLRVQPNGEFRRGPVTILGGAGFVGTNMATRLLEAGQPVRILDNLSRPGVQHNAEHLTGRFGDLVELRVQDVRDPEAVADAVDGASAVFLFAAQVAVTTSIEDPATDFAINVGGAFNTLEALRKMHSPPPLLLTSTNKVYGDLAGLDLVEDDTRWWPAPNAKWTRGVPEHHLDCHSPYGCSKGAADQYVLDYARTYGLPATVFRMSCIYGEHQHGNEDQGWVAHFLLRALRGEPITIFGDGKQVRDILWADDLIDAMLLAIRHIDRTTGRPFNVGGGPANAVSLKEVIERITCVTGKPATIHYDESRLGDQRYYVSDTGRLRETLGWQPTIGADAGVGRLAKWLREHSPLLDQLQAAG
jgi:CDP-paratose 2-epimerase